MLSLPGKFFFLFLFSTILIIPVTYAQQSYVIRPEFTSKKIGNPYNLSPHFLRRPRVGLVLSGGGARGLAHIGVLRAFERHNIPIDLIAGNSMGAIIGALYAAGYSTSELESIAVATHWAELLSLSDEAKRGELYIDQKQAQEHSFLLFRFDGIVPVIPSALSSGQRLTNTLTALTLQAIYHPNPSFDDLKIPFRATATDLISGHRVTLGDGSLSEALRATITVPLLFTPLRRDSLFLVDGGLVSNAPVDIARGEECDLVICSNTTGVMRPADQLNAPWETADQIMAIMMQASNEKQFAMADVVITPDLGNHLSTDFSHVDSLIRLGEKATEMSIDTLKTLFRSRWKKAIPHFAHTGSNDHTSDRTKPIHPQIVFEGDELPADVRNSIDRRSWDTGLMVEQIYDDLQRTLAAGNYADAFAEITETSSAVKITYHAVLNPALKYVEFTGNTQIDDTTIANLFQPHLHEPVNYPEIQKTLERIIKLYRERSLSLARIDSLNFDERTGTLRFMLNEGRIRRVIVEGNDFTRDYVIRREFPQQDGELFDVRKALQGIANINSTGLFEYALLDIHYEENRPVVVLKVEEKSTNNIRIGLRADNERSLLGLIDIRDANLFGTGAQLGFTFASSFRNRISHLEYRATRIFNTLLTFNIRGYYRFDDILVYTDDPSTTDTRWKRMTMGKYRQIKAGGAAAFGAQLERWGNVTTELRTEHQEIKFLDGSGYTPEQYRLVSLKFGTTIDTKNRFPFPTEGVMLTVSYESANASLGSDVAFGKLLVSYEHYSTVFSDHTFRPKITLGVADKTMPLAEHFSLGGIQSFFGLRENDTRGRQLFLVNAEYRFRLPFRVIFDTYLLFRYDFGQISSVPEELRLDKFRHGIGAELALDTPIGPASFSAGSSFYLRRDLLNKPVSAGPIVFYFSIGYGI